MGFRTRLVVYFVVTLLVLQALTAGAVYYLTRDAVIRQGEASLAQAVDVFGRQLNELSSDFGAGIQLLSLDPALRKALAANDRDGEATILRAFGDHAGAATVLLMGADGAATVDTGHLDTGAAQATLTSLAAISTGKGSAASVIMIGRRAYWVVVAPVSGSPAYIASGVLLDDAMLRKLGALAALPTATALASDIGTSSWGLAGAGSDGGQLVAQLPPPQMAVPTTPWLGQLGGDQELIEAAALPTAGSGPRVVALFGYPLGLMLRGYLPALFAIGGVAVAGAVASCLLALMIAKGVGRPFRMLAAAARRIEAGDYTPPPDIGQTDEIGELNSALGSMANAIREREERIRGWARHDPMTGLLNRTGLIETVAGQLADHPSAVLLVGLTRLQEIVNTVGREIADRLMQEAGTRLTALCPHASVACVSDHTFAAFMPNCDRTAAVELAGEIVLAFERPYQERHLAIDATAAIGVALSPEHGTEAALLLQRADVALLAAFRAQNRISVYDIEADPRRPEHLSLMVDLRQAVDRKELSLHYQPKLDLATQKISGVEALVRWQHEFRGMVPPDLFIPLAEETGNITRLTRWALATGIAQAARWLNRGLALRMSINLSVRDLADPQLPRRIASLLAAHDVPAEYLLLEVTESAIMGEPDTAIAVLNALADQGIALSIDDFGVGHSSLAYLRRLPVRELKIDKSFVLDLVKSTGDQKIVQSVIELGHRLGYKVTAEGVEDEDSLLGLSMMGCDYAQGYHIGRPLSRDQMERFFTDSRWPSARITVAS